MDAFDDEKEIVSFLQDIQPSGICMMNRLDDEKRIFETIYEPEQWGKWHHSFGKGDPPPDFYCDSQKLMLEVMRVDDHAFVSKKGKIVNPYKKRESELMNELKEKGILDNRPDMKVFFSANTGLSTEEDHNYIFYRDNFNRVVEAHKKKINIYKKNHPGYKIIFLIFDESSAYCESVSASKTAFFLGKEIQAYRHCHFLDSAFLKSFIHSEIDYLIWFSPYKYIETTDGRIFTEPTICIYNTRYAILNAIHYPESKMISYEK